MTNGGTPSRRRSGHRRVVALSAVDRRRLETGELADPVEALHTGDAPSAETDDSVGRPGAPSSGSAARPAKPATRRPSADDERLLQDVPPHWGNP